MIRKIQHTDIDRCIMIYEDNFSILDDDDYDVRKDIELSLLTEQYVKPYYYVYEKDGRVIAFFGFSENGWDPSSYGLGPCYVDKAYQQQGLGRQCTEYRINEIRKLGGNSVFASVLQENAWHLERFGFNKIGPPYESKWIIMCLFL